MHVKGGRLKYPCTDRSAGDVRLEHLVFGVDSNSSPVSRVKRCHEEPIGTVLDEASDKCLVKLLPEATAEVESSPSPAARVVTFTSGNPMDPDDSGGNKHVGPKVTQEAESDGEWRVWSLSSR